MNTSTTTHAPPAPRRSESTARTDHANDRQRCDDFERLLREKSAAHDDDGDDAADESAAAAPPAGFLTWAAPPPLQQFGGQPDSGCGRLDAAVAAGQAAQAAHAGDPPSATPLAPAADAAGAWEVTLRQPLGAAVDVRATRTTDAVNGWSLAIGSPTLDASVLARHAPKLNERLKARALSNTHVRIEESDREDRQ
jgi:hypothetical protein